MNEDIADRREAYFKPDYSQLPDYDIITPKKRDYKEMIIRDEDEQLTKNFNIFVEQLGSHDSVSDSSSSQILKFRQDGRPLRASKPKKHFDEEYPPDDHSPKRKKMINKNSSGNDSIVEHPIVISKKSSVKRVKQNKMLEENTSDDEDYRKANKRVPLFNGYGASNFLIRKFINKIKYCFDKLQVLHPDNCNNDITLSEKSLELIKMNSQSNGYSYIDHDSSTDKITLHLSRTENTPFIGKNSNKWNLSEAENKLNINNQEESKLEDDKLNLKSVAQNDNYYKFDPNDVYGSFKITHHFKEDNEEKSPTADEIIKNVRKMSNEIMNSDGDVSDVVHIRQDSDIDGKPIDELEIFNLTKPLSSEGLVQEGGPDIDYENRLFKTTDITNIEIIRIRTHFGYYHKLQTLYDDIMFLLKNTLSKRCKNLYAKYYLSEIIYRVQTLFKDKARAKEFEKLYENDFKYKIDRNWFLKVGGKWNKVIGLQRKYIAVDRYVQAIDDSEALERLTTTKTSKCDGT
jgi:hypothetical protein